MSCVLKLDSACFKLTFFPCVHALAICLQLPPNQTHPESPVAEQREAEWGEGPAPLRSGVSHERRALKRPTRRSLD